MINFTEIKRAIIEYSGLVNRSDFIDLLIIATLNDLHKSRKWYKDTSITGWSYEEQKALAENIGECAPKLQTELQFQVGSSELISAIVCDFEGSKTELKSTTDGGLDNFCNKPDKPYKHAKHDKHGKDTGNYKLTKLGGVYTVRGDKPISALVINTRDEIKFTTANFDSSWIVQDYPNTIIYSVVADVLEDTGMHNVNQWLTKATHAIAHLHATEKNYA